MKFWLKFVFSINVASLLLSCAWTPLVRGNDGKVIPQSIASLEEIELGGIKQWILIRGEDISNPILLFLHGGPGNGMLPFLHYYNSDLEEYFTVVTWDQRGAGKSYSRKIPPETMSQEQMLQDAHELTVMLKNRFEQDRIYLVGHSWGAQMGLYLAYRYPQDYYAYIGVSQLINTEVNERLSYEFALRRAREEGNARAISELEELGEPINGFYPGHPDGIMRERRWVMKLGVFAYGKTSPGEFFKVLLTAKEYTICDLFRWIKGSRLSTETILMEIMGKTDMARDVPELEIPVYFCAGRHDYVVPCAQIGPYVETLRAPHKEVIYFDYSGHSPIFEEPEEFNNVMINKVLRETFPQSLPSLR